MRKIDYVLIVMLLTIAITSCRSVKEVSYFQSTDTVSASAMNPVFNYEPTLQPSDILSVFVNSLSPEASSFFNTYSNLERSGGGDMFTTRSTVGYTIDVNGFIELPLVGKVKLSGLTLTLAKDTLTKRLEQYLQYPTVRLYYENFRIIVLGEVEDAGVFNVTNEKITIPEALGMAGDMNIYGDRENVMLVREDNGQKKYYKVNMLERDFFSQPYYYLRSNDILYVPPVKGRISQSEDFWRIAPLVLSTITLVALLVFRFGND